MREFFLNMAPIIWLTNLVLAVMGVVLFEHWRKYRRPLDKPFAALGLLLVFAFIVQSVQIIFKYYYINALWLFNIYPPVEFALLSYFLYSGCKRYRGAVLYIFTSLFFFIVAGMVTSFNEIPVYILIIQYTALTALCAHVFAERPGMIVFGFFMFCAMQTVVISSFVLADWTVPRVLQASINLVTNIILIVGIYGRSRGNYFFGNWRNNHSG